MINLLIAYGTCREASDKKTEMRFEKSIFGRSVSSNQVQIETMVNENGELIERMN